MSSYTRTFALLSATEPDNIPIPRQGYHFAPTPADVPRDDIVSWWNPHYDNGYVYVAHEFGMMEMEIDLDAVWTDLVTVGQRPHHGMEVLWTQRDWQLISMAFDSLRAGYFFSARFQIPSFDLETSMSFWDFLMQYYRQMLLLGFEHVPNANRIEEDNEIYRILVGEDGREIIDLTGDGDTVTTEGMTDDELWED